MRNAFSQPYERNSIMEDMDNGILFIAPSKQIVYTLFDVLREMGHRFPIHEANMDDAVILANSYVESGTKVIVSQGGTANCLKQNVHAYIIEIRYSSFDLIHTVKYALTLSSKVAIIGFESLIYNARQIQYLFPENLIIQQVENKREIVPTIQALVSQGVRAFVGGSLVVTAAETVGAHGVYMDADKRAIHDAINESIRIRNLQIEREMRFEQIRAILNSISEGIIGTDKNGNINEVNPNALELLGMDKNLIMGRNVADFFPNLQIDQLMNSGTELYGEPQRIGNNLFSINSVPIMVNGECSGMVITLQESQQIQSMEHKIRKAILASGHVAKKSFSDIIGESETITKTKNSAKIYAEVDSTVLIYGETGTGKELFAQSIHNASKRAANPFVAVNCAALPENLLESELFGYVKGAFTGAKSSGKVGLFEMAHTGTVFLDEISEMALSLQPRLLRVLQEKEVSRIGDDKITPVDIRVIAATNNDLRHCVNAGTFREDLYYRLSVLIVELPPLRERMTDIKALARNIISQKSRNLYHTEGKISNEALDLLHTLDWPGNIRQLSNVLERAIVISRGGRISEDIMADVLQRCRPFTQRPAIVGNDSPSCSLKKLESQAIRQALQSSGGNKKIAAQRLGISTATLWRKLKDFSDVQ